MSDNSEPEVRRLMRVALGGLEAGPGDPEPVFARAAQVRRRRRAVAVTTAAVVAAGAVTATVALAQGGGGSSPAASAPGPAATTSAVPGASPSRAPTSASPVPPASPASPSMPSAPPSHSMMVSATPRLPPASYTPFSAPAILASYMTSGTGTVTRAPDLATPMYNPGTFSGRYLVTKNGRVGYVDLDVRDPMITPAEPDDSAVEIPNNHCAYATNTQCTTVTLPSGAVLKTWVIGPGGDEPGSGHTSAGGTAAEIYFPDGRHVRATAITGVSGPNGYGTPLAAPPLTVPQLVAMLEDPVWFE